MKKKTDFKKLALMGITGAFMMGSQGTVNAEEGCSSCDEQETFFAYAGCGGSTHGCSGSGGDNNTPNTARGNVADGHCRGVRPDTTQPVGGSCNAKRGNLADADESFDQSKHFAGNGSQKAVNESDLLSKLSPQGKATYSSLSPEGKALALKLANQSCKGQNDCKGLGGCKTSDHVCAGQNGCRGQSGGPFKDVNDAVKAASKKMEDKRASLSSNK